MAVATSAQWGEVFRQTAPGFAASDIVAKTLVKLNTSTGAGDQSFVPVGSTNDIPLGVSCDDYAQGRAAVVYDGPGSLIFVIAGASVVQGQTVGMNGTATEVHPISGNTVTYPKCGPVSGASGSVVWAAGTAETEASPGEKFLLRVAPRQLSGLA